MNDYRTKSVAIQLRAFEHDLRGMPLNEIANELAREFNIIKLTDRRVQMLIDAETVLYGIMSNNNIKGKIC